LQETIIIKAKKTDKIPDTITITSSQSNHDFDNLISLTVDYNLVVSKNDFYVYLVTDDKEEIEIEYITECDNKENFLNLLKSRRKLDIIKGFTTNGVHRDDFVIYINKKRLDIYGSQGQHRTAILSLKLSELNIIEEEIGEYPILLLDDFMYELDQKRRNHFLEKIDNTQVIITCTDKIDIENKNILIYNVKDGNVFKGGN